LEDADGLVKSDPEGPDTHVIVRVQLIERAFEVENVVFFTPDDLLDICLFYQMVIDRVAQAVCDYAQECGVRFGEA
jgi:hypothetical protein